MRYMLDRVGRADSLLRVIWVEGRAAGYLYLEFAPDQTTAFLWYFAVDAEMRNRGVGRLAMIDTLELLRREHASVRYLMFEVRDVEHDDGSHGRPTARSSVDFYRRLGAYVVRGIDYRLPAADDATRSVTYDPMFFVLNGPPDPSEVRERVLLMASDNFDTDPDDPRWITLQRSGPVTILPPPDQSRLP